MLESCPARRHAPRIPRSRDIPDADILHRFLVIFDGVQGGRGVCCIAFPSLASSLGTACLTFEHGLGEEERQRDCQRVNRGQGEGAVGNRLTRLS